VARVPPGARFESAREVDLARGRAGVAVMVGRLERGSDTSVATSVCVVALDRAPSAAAIVDDQGPRPGS
jgi:hypothetical protein